MNKKYYGLRKKQDLYGPDFDIYLEWLKKCSEIWQLVIGPFFALIYPFLLKKCPFLYHFFLEFCPFF